MLSLKGNNEIHPLNLKGQALSLGNSVITLDIHFEKWKSKMMNRLIIPILQKKWTEIYENIFIITVFKKDLEQFSTHPQIDFYRNILTFVERVYNDHEEISHLEKIMYSDGKDGTQLLYKTTMIRVAAEYEIYHSIFGQPHSSEYDLTIINSIREYMHIDNITYKDIKQKIETIYR
tara:strand:+ start:2150 stop:2677 length:528 start_codon:yes stop_codon:yes gene_type:complete